LTISNENELFLSKKNENELKAGAALCLRTDSTPHSISQHFFKICHNSFLQNQESFADAKAMSAT
jgi:hypothetical protein